MYREQAVEIIERHIDNNIASGSLVEQALSMAIDALKAQLSDLISKTETVEHLRRGLEATVPNTDYDEGYIDGIEFGISTVSTMPTVQPQSTTGQLNDSAQSTDLINRQQAIDALDCINGTEEVLRSLPSAQPELQWIPCSERMPETGVEVLTYYEAFDYIEIQTLEDGKWENQRGDWQDLDDIAAWMPLPEAYRQNK